jgi:RNA polymerase sigma-70 factor, ECF subfamily
MNPSHLESFTEHRSLLFGIAWRMLGNVTDAEDILQEAFIRWQRTVISDIRSPRAFLITMVTRLCLNHLSLARVKNELSLGTESALENLPSAEVPPANDDDLADSLDAAFTIVLRCLSPIERAVFLLREVFDRDYGEVARIVEKSEENCRQILRRSRQRIAGQEPRFEVTLDQQAALLEEFLSASTSGDVDRLAVALAGEAILISDGENLGAPAPTPIHGAKAVAQRLISRARELLQSGSRTVGRSFHEMPLLLTYSKDELLGALALVLRSGQVQTVYLIKCPVRLRSLAAQFPAPTGEHRDGL